MATYGWHQTASVREGLAAEAHRFSFEQAVRILESLARHRRAPGQGPETMPDQGPAKGVGESADTEAEAVRFTSRIDLSFPATEIESVELPPAGGGPARMEVGFLGLAGALGPLPRGVTELLYDRRFVDDRALIDFLDIFNHRLISLFYRARKKYRPALGHTPPDRGRVARCLAALAGLGTPHLDRRLPVADRALLLYTGLLVGTRRTMVGLERLLAHYFAAGAEIVPFQGAWHRLGGDQITRLAGDGPKRRGQNYRLGVSAVLGDRVWDQQAAIELRLGPLTLPQLLAFLPNGSAFPALRGLVRFYAGDEVECRLRLTLRADQVPPLRLGAAGDARLGWSARLATPGEDDEAPEPRLGRAGGARLGWTSWLATEPRAADASVPLGVLA